MRQSPLVQMYQIRKDLAQNARQGDTPVRQANDTQAVWQKADAPRVAACMMSGSGDRFSQNEAVLEEARQSIEEEIHAAVHVLGNVAERLRRLSTAYAEWDEFDGCAYFDLTRLQAERLLRVVERVTTVHVTFYADLLLPSFQAAECTLLRQFAPEYRLLRAHLFDGLPEDEQVTVLPADYDAGQAQMIAQWQRLVDVERGVRAILHDDIRFWATNGAEDERARWRHVWMQPAAPGLDARLTPPLVEVPSLTLSIDFPLPNGRQPGRLRRLRRMRSRWRRSGHSRGFR